MRLVRGQLQFFDFAQRTRANEELELERRISEGETGQSTSFFENYFRQRGVSAPNFPLGCGNTTARYWPRESTRVLKVDRDDDVADIIGSESRVMNAGEPF